MTGFTIQIQENVSADTQFDWIALSTGRDIYPQHTHTTPTETTVPPSEVVTEE